MATKVFSNLESATAERDLLKNLKQNPTFPFKREDDVFVREYRPVNLRNGILLFVISAVGVALTFNNDVENPIVLAVVAVMCVFILIALWMMWSGAFLRRLEIDLKKKEYRYYFHKRLLKHGPLQELCIRLSAFYISRKIVKYKLDLMAKEIGVIELSGFLKANQLLHCHGRRLAKLFNLIYYDDRTILWRRPVWKCRNLNPRDINSIPV